MNKTTATLIAAAFAVLSLPALATAVQPVSNPHKPPANPHKPASNPHTPASSRASAPSGGNSANSPAAQCRAERTAMGEANFKSTYGTNRNRSNAFGKCVSRQSARQAAARESASRTCRAERADPNFATAHGGKTFAQFYGTNANDRNAFGKCVSRQARATTAAQQHAQLTAAATCRAEQRSDPAAFKVKYGTNRNRSNAFGKCVSKTVRAGG
jgi:hypothetical protein